MLNYKSLPYLVLCLTIAGVIIGFLKQYQWLLAAMMFFFLVFSLKRKYQAFSQEAFWLCLLGTILTMCMGTLGECWGTYHEYWEYHGLSAGQKIPVWLPFAWALAYLFLYQVEKFMPLTEKNYWSFQGVLTRLLIALILPVYGEIITIYLGVWTYHWPYQLLGVPIYAMFCLVVLHFSVSAVLSYLKHNLWFKKIALNTPNKL